MFLATGIIILVIFLVYKKIIRSKNNIKNDLTPGFLDEDDYMDFDLPAFEEWEPDQTPSQYIKIADTLNKDDFSLIKDELIKDNIVILNTDNWCKDDNEYNIILDKIQENVRSFGGNAINLADKGYIIIVPESLNYKKEENEFNINQLDKKEVFEEKEVLFDNVHFSVTSPDKVKNNSRFLLTLWVHFHRERNEIKKRVKEEMKNENFLLHSKGPVKIQKDTLFHVRLFIEDLIVENELETIYWCGETANATFLVNTPEYIEQGIRYGNARVFVDGIEITRIIFSIEIADEITNVMEIPVNEKKFTRAFISYSRKDKTEVLKRVQALQKITKIWIDFYSLRSGQNWRDELRNAISKSDIFYLFWSKNAAESLWVEREWRCALQLKGIDYIDPIPLVSPEVVPPPDELSSKHFDDWILAHIMNENKWQKGWNFASGGNLLEWLQ